MTGDADQGAGGVSKASVAVDIKVRELRVRAVRVPMTEPHKTASGVVAESPLVLIDAVFDDGARRPRHGVHVHADGAAAGRRLVQNLRAAGHGRTARAGRDRAEARAAVPAAGHARPGRHRARGDRHGALGRARPRCTARRSHDCWAASKSRFRPTARSATTARRDRREAAEDWARRGIHGRQGEDRISDGR